MKKTIVVAAGLALGMATAAPSYASEELAKKSGCMGCHDVSAKKMGPSFKDIAKKYAGNAEAEAKLTATLAEGKKHPATKVSDADRATLVKWVLAQK